MDKILITGVAGFIASKIAQKLHLEGYEVVGVDDLSTGKIENIPREIVFFQGDLANNEFISKLPQNCTLILHLAGQSSGEISFDDPISDLDKNTKSTLNLISYGIKCKCKKILYASSMSVYGEVNDLPIEENHSTKPLSCYGVGKLASEGYLKVYKNEIPFVIFRMFNVYGPGQDLENMRQGMVSIFLSQALKNRKIVVKGSLNRYRDFIYIDDVVNAWYNATFNNNIKNEIINLGTGVKTTVSQLLNQIYKYIPDIEIVEVGTTKGDQTGIYSDNKLLKQICKLNDFKDLSSGMSLFVEWAKNKIK